MLATCFAFVGCLFTFRLRSRDSFIYLTCTRTGVRRCSIHSAAVIPNVFLRCLKLTRGLCLSPPTSQAVCVVSATLLSSFTLATAQCTNTAPEKTLARVPTSHHWFQTILHRTPVRQIHRPLCVRQRHQLHRRPRFVPANHLTSLSYGHRSSGVS